MKKKTLVMLLSAALIITTAAFGTIAYLTDSATVTNRFTVGNVSIDVDEAVVTLDGVPVGDSDGDGNEDRTSGGNTYHLMPGQTYTKDPTLTVKAGSEESYVRMMVTISNAAELKQIFSDLQIMYPEDYQNGFLPQEHVEGWDSTMWPCNSMTEDTTANTITLEFRYQSTVAASDTADHPLPALFTHIKIPDGLTYAQLQSISELTISVIGHAIQSIGFDDADAAWTAFDAQVKAEAKLEAQLP